MTDRPKLSDAYGSAEAVPALLDRFDADPAGVWSELMDRLCPQLDTAFPASFAALPRQAAIAAAREPDDRRWVPLRRRTDRQLRPPVGRGRHRTPGPLGGDRRAVAAR